MSDAEGQYDEALRFLVGRWIKKAAGDLQFARAEEFPAWGRCYHSQQCAEKSIKAILTLLSTDVPHIHDLVELISRVPDDWAIGELSVDFPRLTRWAVTTRYALPLTDATD